MCLGTLYIYQLSGWYGPFGEETVTMRTISLIQTSLGIPGLTGVDQALCFRQATRIANFVKYLDRSMEVRQQQMDVQTISSLMTFRQNMYPFRSNPQVVVVPSIKPERSYICTKDDLSERALAIAVVRMCAQLANTGNNNALLLSP